MTKEEIINQVIEDVVSRLPPLPYSFWNTDRVQLVAEQISTQYAKQQAIAFAELVYAVVPEYNLMPDGKWRCNTGHEYTTIQLYEIFLESQKTKQHETR